MRILKVRFKNLNSLGGEWEIDLTHHTFTSNGIFAITGPTGSGKTTILDAICLALYGRTPRLDKVTGGANEIMSRRTGECFSEVVFETKKGRFRSHWSQRRSRGSPQGELQNPKHEISNADSGKELIIGTKAVADEITKVTGMDFNRFTRSMLLAQGGFAAFLEAPANDRSAILEQITDSEIYSKISQKVFDRCKDEKNRFDICQSELRGVNPFEEKDELLLRDELECKKLTSHETEEKIRCMEQTLQWLNEIANLEKEMATIEGRESDLLRREEAFKPELLRLDRAMRALELSGEYAPLVSMRGEQQRDIMALDESRGGLPSKEDAVKNAEQSLHSSNEKLATKKKEREQGMLAIRKARELDISIREKKLSLRSEEDSKVALEKKIATMRAENDKDIRTSKSRRASLDSTMLFMNENSADEWLVENLAALRNEFDDIAAKDKSRISKEKELAAAQGKTAEAERNYLELSKKREEFAKKIEEDRAIFKQRRIKYDDVLSGIDIGTHRELLCSMKEKQLELEKLDKDIASSNELRRTLDGLNLEMEEFSSEKGTLESSIKDETQREMDLKQKLHSIEANLISNKKIRDLEELRGTLMDGAPCPLCGSKEHPYANGNIPIQEVDSDMRDRLKNLLEESSSTLNSLNIKYAKISKDLEFASIRQKDCIDQIDAVNKNIADVCARLSMNPSDPKLADFAHGILSINERMLDALSKTISEGERLEKEIRELFEAKNKNILTMSEIKLAVQQALHKKELEEKEFHRLADEIRDIERSLRDTLNDAVRALSRYGINSLTIENLQQVTKNMTSRRDRWIEKVKEKEDLVKEISIIENRISDRSNRIAELDNDIELKKDILSKMMQEMESLSRERMKILGNKDPDKEDSRMSLAVDDAEKELEHDRQWRDSTVSERDALKRSIDERDKAIISRTPTLMVLEGAFCVRIGEKGFIDESDYKRASMDDVERNALAQQSRQMTAERVEVNASLTEGSSRLKNARDKRLTDQPREKLSGELQILNDNLKKLQQEIGAEIQRLKDNDLLKSRRKELVESLERQKIELARWDLLNRYIGAKDGKKYRSFAQGVTFEAMIGHANHQLRKMTDRYLLIRDGEQPLGLNVVDNYQGGEIRSTKNLSGGESFIVSLSLALGLSRMVSRNVRVDSLFLDEGFGTLDEESLDMALETLSGLSQDGKLIGVISHVPAIKERISAQIYLSPQAGGKSVINGPGCRRIA